MCKKIDVEVVRSQLIAWMADNGKSQAEVSKSMGISASALSMFIKGTYTGDNEQIGRKAAALMDLVHRQSAVAKTPGFVETSIAEEILLLPIMRRTIAILALYTAMPGSVKQWR